MNEVFEIQTRETFPLAMPPLGTVQVQDELGLSYLEGDIDFGAVGRNEILQNIKFIILTEVFSVPLDREFGMDYSMIDKPMRIAEVILAQEVAMKISLYEPRAQFREINYVEDMLNGKLSPSVRVALLTTNELPSSLPLPSAEGLVTVGILEEVDLPGFYETLIALARVPGPQGPEGPKGKAATIEVGETTTGAPGTDAEVVNVGDEHEAIFDFVIPRGEKGDQGEGVSIEGTVPDVGDLPTTGNDVGDIWIDESTGDGWSWNGTDWVNIGPIQGPQGEQGETGPQGVQGVPGNAATVAAGTTTTGAPGTNANVSNSGNANAAVFDFTIPRGDVGAQGVQGPQGAQGPIGPTGQVWRGAWNAATNYVANDAVEYQGSTFICTAPNINSPPVPDTASNWLPPLANVGNRGSLAALPPSNQGLYYARGDNTWALFTEAIPPVGSIAQTAYFTGSVGGSTSAQASVYSFSSDQGQAFASFVFTPKYSNSLLRVSWAFHANIMSGTTAGWYGFALFKDAESAARTQSWHYTTVPGAGAAQAAFVTVALSSAVPITLILKGAVGQSGSGMSTPYGVIVFIDEIKQ